MNFALNIEIHIVKLFNETCAIMDFLIFYYCYIICFGYMAIEMKLYDDVYSHWLWNTERYKNKWVREDLKKRYHLIFIFRDRNMTWIQQQQQKTHNWKLKTFNAENKKP